MTDNHLDPMLLAAFDNAKQDLVGVEFTTRVMSGADKLKRRAVARRILLGLGLALIGIQLQDYALALSQILVLSVVALDDLLLAQILAPVNTVGSLLSLVVLGLRIVHKRIFS